MSSLVQVVTAAVSEALKQFQSRDVVEQSTIIRRESPHVLKLHLSKGQRESVCALQCLHMCA